MCNVNFLAMAISLSILPVANCYAVSDVPSTSSARQLASIKMPSMLTFADFRNSGYNYDISFTLETYIPKEEIEIFVELYGPIGGFGFGSKIERIWCHTYRGTDPEMSEQDAMGEIPLPTTTLYVVKQKKFAISTHESGNLYLFPPQWGWPRNECARQPTQDELNNNYPPTPLPLPGGTDFGYARIYVTNKIDCRLIPSEPELCGLPTSLVVPNIGSGNLGPQTSTTPDEYRKIPIQYK